MELIKTTPELKEKVDILNKDKNAKVADFIALAAEYGVTLTQEDFTKKPDDGELSDEELEAVAGGGTCWCMYGGGGEADPDGTGYHGTCACVLGGGGEGRNGCEPCVCILGGYGE